MGVRQLVEYQTQSRTVTFPVATVNVVGLAPSASFGALFATFGCATVNTVGLAPTITPGALSRSFSLATVNAQQTSAPVARGTNTFGVATINVIGLAPSATFTTIRYQFQPPAVFDVPRISPDTQGPANTLFRHFSNLASGQTVLKIGGEFINKSNPSAIEAEEAEVVYVGGHIYEIDQAAADELTAAGYTVSIISETESPPVVIPPPPPPPPVPPAAQTATFTVATVRATGLTMPVVSAANRTFQVAQVRVSGLAPTATPRAVRTFPIATVRATGLTPTAANNAVGPIADDFNGTVLDPTLWTFEDPVGGSSVSVSGGLLRINVAGVVDHDSYSALLSPRVYQRINDANFYIEAKMNTSVSNDQDSMGFLVTSTDEHSWVRANFVRLSGTVYCYAAWTTDNGVTINGGVASNLGGQAAPLWLRLYYVKSTHSWTVEYSGNGTTFTNAGTFVANFAPARMHLAAGNSAPGYLPWTATFDHIHLPSGSPVAPPPPPPPSSGAHYLSAFRFGASQSNLQPIEDYLNRQLDLELVHGLYDTWSNFQSVGFSGLGEFPGRRISFTADILAFGTSFVAAANGSYDSFWFNQVNQIVNSYGHPDAILRTTHEFNLSGGYPWYAGEGTQWTVAQYVALYRRYVQVARTVPNQRLRFDWCYLFGDGVDVFNGGYYPGDDVVDIIGCDMYNRNLSSNLTTRWNLHLTHYNGLNNLAAFASAHNKLISFPEMMNANYTEDPSASSGDDQVFMANMRDWMAAHPVEYFTWYADGAPIESDWYDDPNFINSKLFIKANYGH